MLSGEDFRGRHQGTLMAVAPTAPNRRGGNHGLAAADVPFQKTIHPLCFSHISVYFLHGFLLSRCGLKGQKRKEILFPAPLHGDAFFRLTLTAKAKGEPKKEKFLKDETAATAIERFKIIGKMISRHRFGAFLEIVGDAKIRRQKFRDRTGAKFKGMSDNPSHQLLIDAGGKGVNRQDPETRFASVQFKFGNDDRPGFQLYRKR